MKAALRRLLLWLAVRSRPARIALWTCIYASCCVAEFVAKWVKEHSGEKIKELWND